jgi:hypothetical protein
MSEWLESGHCPDWYKYTLPIINMNLAEKISNIHIKNGILYAIVLSFLASVLFPGIGPNTVIETLLVFIGILFGIIVGFFLSDLYSRFQTIKDNAAVDASGLATYYQYAKLLVRGERNRKWLARQRDIIYRYVTKFMPLPWSEYSVTDKEFNEILESLKKIKYRTNKENETYSNILAVVSEVSDAREKLVMSGRDHLTRGEWIVVLLLGGLLLFSLYYVKTMEPVSIAFTGLLSSSILILLLVIRDLDNLKFGEIAVSIEPYERVLDTIGKPRYKVSSKV